MTPRPGLEWKEAGFGLQPQWTAQPDMTIIQTLAMKHLNLANDPTCKVSFYAEGAFNKLFKIEHTSGTWLMRVALPVEPYFKTESETATIQFVRNCTDMPAPAIIAHDSSLDEENPLGFEWMIMEFMPGRPLRSAWRKMSLTKKETLVRQLALHQSQLHTTTFDQVGNLYTGDTPDTHKIGRIVALPFFWGDRTESGKHGPFRNSQEWLHAQLSLILIDKAKVLAESEDEDDLEDAQDATDLGEELLRFLPEVFHEEETESTVVFHDDLSMMNILVDSDGHLTAVVDWECVSALPLWKACQYPQLLQGRTRVEKPQRETYAPASDDEDEHEGIPNTGKSLDDEGVNSLYWDHLLEYEIGHLRPLFVEEMERLLPGWKKHWLDGELRRDFELIISNVDRCWALSRARRWLDAYRNGKPASYADMT